MAWVNRWRWCFAVCLLAVAGGCQSLGWNGFGQTEKPKHTGYDPFAETHGWSAQPTSQQKNDVQMAVALSQERQGQPGNAIRIYSEIVARDKKHAAAHHRLAMLYEKKGDAASALKHYREAVKYEPKNAEIQCDYGYCCYLRRDWPTAESSLRKAAELQPGLARAHNNLGMLLMRTGRPDEALREFLQAGCNEPAARTNMALALTLEGRFDEAERLYRQALTSAPDLKPAQEGLAALDRMRQRSVAVGAPPTMAQIATPTATR